MDRPIVVANYVTDVGDLTAVEGVRDSHEKLRNPSDRILFKELTAPADAIITGTHNDARP